MQFALLKKGSMDLMTKVIELQNRNRKLKLRKERKRKNKHKLRENAAKARPRRNDKANTKRGSTRLAQYTRNGQTQNPKEKAAKARLVQRPVQHVEPAKARPIHHVEPAKVRLQRVEPKEMAAKAQPVQHVEPKRRGRPRTQCDECRALRTGGVNRKCIHVQHVEPHVR